jgi:hypothetical protein
MNFGLVAHQISSCTTVPTSTSLRLVFRSIFRTENGAANKKRKVQKKEMPLMATLPNGKPIDLDMLETAMEDSDLANRYFLNLVTGEVVFFSDYLGLSDEDEQLLEEIDGSNDYVAIERIPSHEAYQWMVDFVDEMVAPNDEAAAEKLSIALDGKGAFRRFKETFYRVDEHWIQAWYQWRDRQLKAALDEWIKSVL